MPRYYLKLIEVFGLPGSGQCRTSYRPSSFEETELMDTVGLHGEIGGLGPGQITSQARDLLLYCLDNGGDTNLPTTDAARTIFHMTLVAPVIDPGLTIRMLEKGANVNLADVHNTTPIMDIISLGDQARARHWLGLLQPLMLDIENCSLQSGLWRSVFQGHSLLSLDMIAAGAKQSSASRVEMITRPAPRISRHSGIKTTVPALLAPLLSDSPCTAQLHARLPRRRSAQSRVAEFSYHAVSHVCRHCIAPAVDAGLLQTSHVQGLVSSLISQQTDHSMAGDSAVVDSASLLPLMFGQLGAGLRQLAVRAVLSQILFSCPPEEAQRKIDQACQRQGLMLTQLLVKPTLAQAKTPEEPSMMSYEYEIELGSEMELSFGRMERGDNDHSAGEENIESVELAVSDIVVSDNPPSEGEETASSYSDAMDDTSIEDYAKQTVSELEDTIANIDRELEVIKTDYELDTLDRDLANLQDDQRRNINRVTSTLHDEVNREIALLSSRLENLHEEAESLQSLLGCRLETLEDVERVKEEDLEERKALEESLEDCRKKKEEVIEEQKVLEEQLSVVQQRIRQLDLRDAEGEEVSIPSEETETNDLSTNNTTEHNDQSMSRRWLDENWSLGSDRVLAVSEEQISDTAARGTGEERVHTETLVRTLTVAANYSTVEADADSALEKLQGQLLAMAALVKSDNDSEEKDDKEKVAEGLEVVRRVNPSRHRPPLLGSSDSSDSEDEEGRVPPPSENEPSHHSRIRREIPRCHGQVNLEIPRLTDSDVSSLSDSDDSLGINYQTVNPRTGRRNVSAFSDLPGSLPELVPIEDEDEVVTLRPPGSARTMPPLADSDSSDTEEEENSSYDSDTWGGTFSLRHTRTRAEAECEAGAASEASLILRLTPRTLFALTDSVGIPHSLRPLFSIEAARLQLCLALFYHKSISCDRNCEGDESESDDSEEDWLATDTETEEDDGLYRSDENREEENDDINDDDDRSTSSSVSNFSQRSWYGSIPRLTPATTPPPLVHSSDSEVQDGEAGMRGSSSWLEDRDDLMRVRQFLETGPGPDFTHSTDSEED